MRGGSIMRAVCALALVLWFTPCLILLGGEVTPASRAAGLVGDAGRLSVIEFQGNKAFDREQLLWALKFDFEVQEAAHPLASLSNYIGVLEKKVLEGYRREGFPDASVHASLKLSGSNIVAEVAEGPRFRCGNVKLTGAGLGTNDAVLTRIRAALVDLRPRELESVIWHEGAWAPCDAGAKQVLRSRIEGVLAELGYFAPKMKLKVVPVPAKQVAELEVELDTPGTEAVLEQIDIQNLFRNTRQQVLDFLKLKPGMTTHPGLDAEVAEKLMSTGRFFKQDAQLSKLDQPGHFKLTLKLDEVEVAPTLDQPATPAEAALLKFGERVRQWDSQSEDWVCTVELSLPHSFVKQELVLSSAGIAGAVWAGSSNRPPGMKAAALFAGRKLALYLPGAHRKAILEPQRGFVLSALSVPVPTMPFALPIQTLHFNFGDSFTQPSPKLVNFSLDLPPVNCLCAAHYFESKVENNEAMFTERDDKGAAPFQMKLELSTGRLLGADYGIPGRSVHVQMEEGGFARLVNEITAAGITCSNVFGGNLAEAVFRDAVERVPTGAAFSWGLEPEVLVDLESLIGASQTNSFWNKVRTEYEPAWQGISRAWLLLGTGGSGRVLEPIKRLWEGISTSPGDEQFHIPSGRLAERSSTQQGLGSLAAATLAEADSLFRRGSWPWTVLRETILALEGSSTYTAESLQRLRESEDIGPVGCAAIAAVLSKASITEARVFARKGMGLLTPEAFGRDYECLLATNTTAGETLRNVLAAVTALTPEQMAVLAPEGNSAKSLFIRDLAQTLRSEERATANPGWPVIEQHWDKVVRPIVERALKMTLPQAPSLTNNHALVERAHELAPKARDSKPARTEMLECLTKAAEQGDAGAQYELGNYCQATDDTKGALAWLEKAAAQDYPHTGCRLGDMYSKGQGVPPDLKRADMWYRREAEHGCSWSQFRVGKLLMDEGKTEEALKWYRRSAENRQYYAMVALGEFYGDDLFGSPDYVGAYMWLRLAATMGDVASSASLRRVRQKLTPEQLQQAWERGRAVSKRMNNKEQDEARNKSNEKKL